MLCRFTSHSLIIDPRTSHWLKLLPSVCPLLLLPSDNRQLCTLPCFTILAPSAHNSLQLDTLAVQRQAAVVFLFDL
jgi:hypothetical protein